MTVKFWSFTKKQNSTAQPSASPAYTFNDVRLKDESGVLHPVLEIFQSAVFNPSALNYAQIVSYTRYYYVDEWRWILGRWECSLSVDTLATFRTQIGLASKYVLRSSYEYNKTIIDTTYPALQRKNVTKTTENVGFAQDMVNGIFILGVVSFANSAYGSVCYYGVNALEMSALCDMMFPQPADSWATAITSLTDTIYRSIYDPFQYIVSCEWFPYYDTNAFGPATTLTFGNYATSITGYKLQKFSYFPVINFNMYLPTGFVNLDARERCSQYNSLYFHLEPWGKIQLNIDEIEAYSALSIYIKIDYVSGKGLLQIYNGVSNSGYLMYEAIAKLSSTINLSAQNTNFWGVVSGAVSAVSAVAGSNVTSAIGLAGGVASAMQNAAPYSEGIIGYNSGFSFLDGYATLLLYQSVFPNQDNDEMGKPLYDTRNLGNIPGYIKCAEGDISLNGYPEEVQEVSNYLTGGFYFE